MVAKCLLAAQLLVDPHALALHEVAQFGVGHVGRRGQDQLATTVHSDLQRTPAVTAPQLEPQVVDGQRTHAFISRS